LIFINKNTQKRKIDDDEKNQLINILIDMTVLEMFNVISVIKLIRNN